MAIKVEVVKRGDDALRPWKFFYGRTQAEADRDPAALGKSTADCQAAFDALVPDRFKAKKP